jgi:RND family efflux transporter MFP subunit
VFRQISLLLAFLLSAPLDAAPFATATAEFREVDSTYATEALIEAAKQSTVAAQIAGRVVEIKFDVGDYVQKGQVIARIDEREAGHALAGSEAQVAQAQANLQNTKATYERTRQLFEQKFVSQAALDKALADYKAAQAQTQATLAGAGQAATAKGYTTIVAPYSGVVGARLVELGEMATPGKPLMVGFDPRDLRAVANVPQYKLAEIRRASRAKVEFPALGKWIDAQNITILPAADAKTHATRVRLDLPENLRDVYPGMYARAHFSIGRTKKLLVPAAALVRRSEVTAVYVIDEKGGAVLRQVRLGEAAGEGQIEILAGLTPGETVALEPIKAGMTLKGKF